MKREMTSVFLLFASLAACTRQECVVERFEAVAVTENHLDENTELTFCKGGASPAVRDARVGIYDAIVLGSVTLKERGDGKTCGVRSGDEKSKLELVPVALTSKSFSEAKLCYRNAERTSILIMDPSQKCPPGTIEQTEPVDDCSSLRSF